ncbi:hypothetical protein PPERSA_11860 [Pseudocohnilembus persalinus]|uniref:Ubiquitin-like protease family profile domain-containing protein n=1 Tax=Pseudocohnilembus persalinus TaxID=266149 RepID=A0A0V0QK37_PSEPJ|nr:hypothetical protein PPERSA_11860 [Pseudocohnilembus persalinus]|eukprot:KRX02520.1 hypothetical protein PPERSA_11860 [Pseudocohnilembus persalinus]
MRQNNENYEIKNLFKQIYQHPFLTQGQDQFKQLKNFTQPNKRDQPDLEEPITIDSYEEFNFLNEYNQQLVFNKNGVNQQQRNTIGNQQRQLLKKRTMDTPQVNEDMIEFIRKKQKIKFDEEYNKDQDQKNIEEFKDRIKRKIQYNIKLGKTDGFLESPRNWEQKQETHRWKNFQHQYEYELGGMKKSEEIKEKDIQYMAEWTYLNDTDINFFISLVKEQQMLEYSKQIDKEKKNLENYITKGRKQILQNVREKMFYDPSQQQHIRKMMRWAKEDLLTKNYIILPLNKESHWSTMVVYNFQGLAKQIRQLLNKRREMNKKNQSKNQNKQNNVSNQKETRNNGENQNQSQQKNSQFYSIDISDNEDEKPILPQKLFENQKAKQSEVIDLEDSGEEEQNDQVQQDQQNSQNNIQVSSSEENSVKQGQKEEEELNNEISNQEQKCDKMEEEEVKVNQNNENESTENKELKQNNSEENQQQQLSQKDEKELVQDEESDTQNDVETIDFEKQMKEFLSNSDDKYQPCIIYLDSFQSYDEHYIDVIRCFLEKYIQQQLKNKEDYSEEEIADIKITEDILPCYQPMCPRQNNSYDCGLFIIEFIEQFLSNPEYILKLIHSEEGLLCKLNWFPKILTNRKRKMLKDLLYEYKYENPQRAIQKYKEQREKIIYDQKMQEFDAFDEKKSYNQITRLDYYKAVEHLKDTQEYKNQLYKDMLIFYYNTSNNPNFRDNPPKMF